jgi:hypothetical protein
MRSLTTISSPIFRAFGMASDLLLTSAGDAGATMASPSPLG